MGSLFVAVIAQSRWLTQTDDAVPITYRLLRPSFSFHFYFVLAHMLGGTVYALNLSGYHLSGIEAMPSVFDLATTARAQQLMLLGHAGVTAGMKLIGFRYKPCRYSVSYIPRYSLIAISFVCLGVGTACGYTQGLHNLGDKFLHIASIAVLVEIVFAVAQRTFDNLIVAFGILLLNLLSQTLSGWKGLSLWTMITLSALLYPIMPRRALLGGFVFGFFWMLFLHPFGLALRPLIWQERVDQRTAAALAMETAVGMSMQERLDNVWTMLVERASELPQFEKYLKFVPDIHPYFGTELIQQAAIGVVPRIVWPSKPDLERLAMERVYQAGVVPETSTVSAKSNFFQDAYLSGDWMGVAVASLLLGSLLMVISRAAEQLFGGYELGTCLIFTSLFGDIVQGSPNFLFLVGSVGSGLAVMCSFFFLGRATGCILRVDTQSP